MLKTADQPRRLVLKVDVDETNIDRLEIDVLRGSFR